MSSFEDDASITKICTFSVRKMLVLVGKLILSTWDTYQYLFGILSKTDLTVDGAFYNELTTLKDWKFKGLFFSINLNNCLQLYYFLSSTKFSVLNLIY